MSVSVSSTCPLLFPLRHLFSCSLKDISPCQPFFSLFHIKCLPPSSSTPPQTIMLNLLLPCSLFSCLLFCLPFIPSWVSSVNLSIHTVRWDSNEPDQNFLVLRSNKFEQQENHREKGHWKDRLETEEEFLRKKKKIITLDRIMWLDLWVVIGVKVFVKTVFK